MCFPLSWKIQLDKKLNSDRIRAHIKPFGLLSREALAMKYNISQAAKIAGITRPTLRNHIKEKPISVEVDENGHKNIDASELIRVYGDKCKFPASDIEKLAPTEEKKEESKRDTTTEIERLKLELENEHLKTQSRALEEQIAHLKERLEKADEQHTRLTALIEDQSSKVDSRSETLEKSIDALRNQVSNDTKKREDEQRASEERERKLKARAIRLQKALEEERRKSIWDRIFSSKKARARASDNAQASTS